MTTRDKEILFIFDVDGCIMDTMNYFARFIPQVFEKFSITMDEDMNARLKEEIMGLLAGRSSKILILKIINHAAKKMGMGFAKRLRFFRYLKHIYNENIGNVELIPGTMETFKLLKAGGNKIALFTTGSMKDFKVKFKKHEALLDMVDATITKDHVKHMKPNPEGIFKIKDQLGLDESNRVVMIGDMVHDMVAGLNAGALPVGVLTGVEKREELLAAGAKIVLDSVGVLPGALGTIEAALSNSHLNV
nr:HAD family hydrolase [Candidatus Sigynarchaeota archaeon]